MKLLKFSGFLIFFFFAVFLLFYKFWFLRLPERKLIHNEALFISPANGEIVSIKKWNKESLAVTKEQFGLINVWTKDVDTAGWIVSIQMDPTNVHYQRLPISSKLIYEKETLGSFHNALKMSNEYGIRFENEHNELLFESKDGKRFKIIQIAGFLARRIEDYVEVGKVYNQSDVIGLIKLGSQVTVIIPDELTPQIQVGETVTEGETILAK